MVYFSDMQSTESIIRCFSRGLTRCSLVTFEKMRKKKTSKKKEREREREIMADAEAEQV